MKAWTPKQLTTLVAYWRADLGITLGTTLLASGTTPPVVTITDTSTYKPGLRIELQTTGTRGTATFRYSADNGTSFIESSVATAATYNLQGAATGIIVAFPAGTYTNDNVYKATVASWADQSGNAHTLTAAAATNQPLLIANSINGRPGLQFNGTSNLIKTGNFTMNQPLSYVVDMKVISRGGAGVNDLVCDGTVAGMVFAVDNSPAMYIYAGGSVGNDATSHTSYTMFTGIFNGANSAYRINAVNNLTGNAGANNPGGFSLGGGVALGARNTNIEVSEFVILSTGISPAAWPVTQAESYARARIAV